MALNAASLTLSRASCWVSMSDKEARWESFSWTRFQDIKSGYVVCFLDPGLAGAQNMVKTKAPSLGHQVWSLDLALTNEESSVSF